MKKSVTTQELVNIYPGWSRVRKNEQAVGYQYLNAIAKSMEKMDKSLKRMRLNQYVATANLDEIDLTYKVSLGASFEFDEDTSDVAGVIPLVPSVSGLLDSSWYDITLADNNDIRTFWYESVPNRASLADTVSGTNHELLTFEASGITISGQWDHHLDAGAIYVEAEGGTQYIELDSEELKRTKVLLTGKTRQGVEDSETLIFPWPMRQKTVKDWRYIDSLSVYNADDGVEITLTSADLGNDDYLDVWNLRFSEGRHKVDEFWGIGSTTSGSKLERIGYVSDEWQQLVLGFIEKETKEEWELLDSSMQPVTLVDIALQPFMDRVWGVTQSGILLCYDTDSYMPSGIDRIKDRTDGTVVQIDIEPRYVLIGENIEFIPWHARPLQEIVRYRLWYQTPSGAKFGLLDGSPVSFNSDFWVVGRQLNRTITDLTSITATERGDYLLALDAVMDDESELSDRVIVSVNYKLPLTTIDISSLVVDPIESLEFDSDQKLWVKTANEYHQIDFHTDVMLIDFEQKILYFKEPYEEVAVETDG